MIKKKKESLRIYFKKHCPRNCLDVPILAPPCSPRTGIQNANLDSLEHTQSSETLHFVYELHFRGNY